MPRKLKRKSGEAAIDAEQVEAGTKETTIDD
jgi:hypothetical protein